MIDVLSQEWAVLCYGRDQREEGRREAKEEIARNMAVAGTPDEQIAWLTELPLERLRQLRIPCPWKQKHGTDRNREGHCD